MVRFIMAYKSVNSNIILGQSSLIKNYKRTVVCIKEEDTIYKVIAASSSRDGSINFFFPYCKRKDAFVFQHTHIYKGGSQEIKPTQIRREFIIDKECKLSIHKSGFVQLSGNGILSGIEWNGKPKGVGIFSSPLSKPVFSGPTIGFQCWGVNKGFKKLISRKKDVQYIILDQNDFHPRMIEHRKDGHSYTLEFWVFPKEANEFVYEFKGEPFINHIIPNYIHSPGAIFVHQVLDIKFDGVLCIFPLLDPWKFDSDYGFIIGSPGGSDCKYRRMKKEKHLFRLVCPRVNSLPKVKDNPPGLEYKKN